jgi:hypothetical protein
MIRYSTQPSKDANALTDSPTSPKTTTKDVRGLMGDNDDEKSQTLLDLDAEDNNE